MSLRIQAFEIIRTWLFYTLVKGEYHTESLPWKDVMISGWGLNEQGKKVSKRDLEKFTDATGYNRYNPYSLVTKYGADALRYWAASSQLGQDLRYQERDVKDGRKIVVKLWNVARLCSMYLEGFDPAHDRVAYSERPVEDQWVLEELNQVVRKMTDSFEKYDYATAKEDLNKFFWMTYCDNYLELVKSRFSAEAGWSERDKKAAQATLWETLRTLLGLFAPYLPYVTEEIYRKAERFGEKEVSLHITSWPEARRDVAFERKDEMEVLLAVLLAARKTRSDRKIGQGTILEKVLLDASGADEETKDALKKLQVALKGACRASFVGEGEGSVATSVAGLKIELIAYPEGQAPSSSKA